MRVTEDEDRVSAVGHKPRVAASTLKIRGSSNPHINDPQRSLRLRYLEPEEYSLWDALVEESPQGSVFCRSWFLKAVAADIRVLGCFIGERLIAGMPIYFERRYGLTFCKMPPLVPTWGVVVAPFEGKYVTVFSREMEVLTVFAKELTKQRIFIQSFHPTLSNWLPFYWNGFQQTTHFTNVFQDLTNLDRVWDQMDCRVRNIIRKAEKSGVTVVRCDSGLVATMAEKTFTYQRKSLPYTRPYIARLCREAQQHDSGECFAAVDQDGKTHAATFLVWDHKQAYYLASGTDPQLRTSGAQSLLLWHSIKFASSRAEVFDLEGSVVEHIEKFFSGFGAKLVPYNRILKFPRAMWAGLTLMGIR